MQPWQDDQLSILAKATTAQGLFTALARLVREQGFDLCSYGIRPPLPIAEPRITVYDNFPDSWHEKYRRFNYVQVDPTVQHGLRSLLPLVWSDALFGAVPEFWEDARGHGLRYGWAQPCRDAIGIAGMLTVARSHEPLTEQELRERVPRLLWITQIAHAGMSRLALKRLLPEGGLRFSKREIGVMRWTAEGRTAAEVAQLLGISERTANFHISNVVAKLGVTNKTAAVIRMALLGFLS